jgi:hypothetical protein
MRGTVTIACANRKLFVAHVLSFQKSIGYRAAPCRDLTPIRAAQDRLNNCEGDHCAPDILFTSHGIDLRDQFSLVESTVNGVISKCFAKRQQMQWTKRGRALAIGFWAVQTPNLVTTQPLPHQFHQPAHRPARERIHGADGFGQRFQPATILPPQWSWTHDFECAAVLSHWP